MRHLSKRISVTIDDIAMADLFQISIGAYSPLTEFMNEADYYSVLDSMRLVSGEIWPIPITLPVTSEQAKQLQLDDEILLSSTSGRVLGSMWVTNIYKVNHRREALQVYKTLDHNHPGVKALFERGQNYLGGPVKLLESTFLDSRFTPYIFSPEQSKTEFFQRGWKSIVGFQTRNPIHRAHEYIQKCALEIVDGLFINPLVGPTKSDDIPPDVRLKAYQAILPYFPSERVYFGLYFAPMRYAGPREAVMHALVRKNYGCTHFIVGRDHAGVGNYYGPLDSQKIFHQFSLAELGITPLMFEHSFYCTKCEGVATSKTCPHSLEFRVELSGTRVREMLKNGVVPPREFSRPEVIEVLMNSD